MSNAIAVANNETTLVILKWLGGIAAVVLAGSIMTGGAFLVSGVNNLTVSVARLETRMEMQGDAMKDIQRRLQVLEDKVRS